MQREGKGREVVRAPAGGRFDLFFPPDLLPHIHCRHRQACGSAAAGGSPPRHRPLLPRPRNAVPQVLIACLHAGLLALIAQCDLLLPEGEEKRESRENKREHRLKRRLEVTPTRQKYLLTGIRTPVTCEPLRQAMKGTDPRPLDDEERESGLPERPKLRLRFQSRFTITPASVSKDQRDLSVVSRAFLGEGALFLRQAGHVYSLQKLRESAGVWPHNGERPGRPTRWRREVLVKGHCTAASRRGSSLGRLHWPIG